MSDPKAFLARLEQEHRAGDLAGRVLSASSEAYRLARRDARTAGFLPAGRSGDAAILESADLMHARVRDLVRNTAQFTRIVEALTDLVVGNGIQTFSAPFDPWTPLDEITPDFLDEGLQFALEADDRFDDWSQSTQFDAEGKLTRSDFERLAFRECVEVGSAIILRCQRDDPGRAVPLCYQLIEREQLDRTRDRPGASGQNKIVNGIELDRNNREVAFWIYDAHPHDTYTGGSSTSTRVPAERVIHLYAFKRPSQSIGVTWLHAIGQSSFDRDKFLGNEIASAAKAALLALIFKRTSPGRGSLGLETGESTDTDDYGNPEVRLSTSTLAAEIGTDEDVQVVESKRPTNTADGFLNLLDHDIAAGGGVSYYTLTGRFERTNYTGFRGACLQEDNHVQPIQGWFLRRLSLPVRQDFNRQAAALGLYRSVSPLQFSRERRFQRFDAIGPGRQFLDPADETEAALGKLRGGLTTLKIECARQGLHWVKVLRQQAIESRYANALGLVLDFSKGEGGKLRREEEAAT